MIYAIFILFLQYYYEEADSKNYFIVQIIIRIYKQFYILFYVYLIILYFDYITNF